MFLSVYREVGNLFQT